MIGLASARRLYTFCRQAVEQAGMQAEECKVEVPG